jgi:PIN domain nuclease of toxin-antitoxin system
MGIKYLLDKLPEAKPLVDNYPRILARAKFIELTITAAHALRDRAFHMGLIQVIPKPGQKL